MFGLIVSLNLNKSISIPEASILLNNANLGPLTINMLIIM